MAELVVYLEYLVVALLYLQLQVVGVVQALQIILMLLLVREVLQAE
jgi:hypothetical protein